MKKRNVQADLIRTISCILVIAVHTRAYLVNIIPDAEYWIKPIAIVCNPMFFMLSGRFALRPFSDNRQGYIAYYKKKVVDILIPYFLICMLLFFWNNEFASFDFSQFIRDFFATTKITYQLWFMRPMIGLLISAPFISTMINNLSESGQKTIIVIGVIWNFLSTIFFANILHIQWGYTHWILETWTLYFVLGYLIDKLQDNKKVVYFILGGGLCYVITVIQKMYVPQDSLTGIEDISPIFTGFAVAVYLFLDRFVIVHSEKLGKTLQFISRRSFFIFLIHVNIINELERHGLFNHISNPWLNYIVRTIVIFMLALLLAWILEKVYGLIKFLCWGIGKRICCLQRRGR